jgi:5-methylcytosine-specific restriction protein A
LHPATKRAKKPLRQLCLARTARLWRAFSFLEVVMCDHTRGRRGVALRKPRLAAEPLCRRCKEHGLTAAATHHVTLLALGGEDVDSSIRCVGGPAHEIVTAEEFGLKQRVTIGVDGWPV